MRKRSLIFITFAPFIYLYALVGNHFDRTSDYKTLTYEFILEYIQGWRILLGKKYIDSSVKVHEFEYKQKVKKAKVNMDISLLMKKLYGSWHIYFDKKKKEVEYNNRYDYGDCRLKVIQISKDEFKIEYYNDIGWNKKRTLFTDYKFSKEQVIDTIKFIKKRYA